MKLEKLFLLKDCSQLTVLFKAKEKPLLTTQQKKNRLRWSKEHKNWTTEQWRAVQWSDEARFEVCVGDSRSRVIRRKNEAFHSDCLKRKVKYPASLMVWGSMSSKGVGKLNFIEGIVNTEKYLDILEESLLPVMEQYLTSGQDFLFQQDGAACHTSKRALKWMEDFNVPLLEWISSSPDLSPIETLWHEMKKALRTHPARTIPELKQKLQEIWHSFTPQFCEGLVNTMPHRILTVIKNKGMFLFNFLLFVSILY